jgi:mannose-1-phosphate guanylyltransferase / mannose-6-phosphate isomerase
MTRMITPVVLCGGMGSRLWPMSRVDQPKQFQPVNGRGSPSFFQTTIQRHRGAAFNDPIVVTNAAHEALVARQMQDLQLQARIIAEPMGRNTGPAVLAAAVAALEDDGDALLLILPSDHIIRGNVNRTIQSMAAAADDGLIVTFGVRPTYPETGFGYITDGGAFSNYPGLHRVAQFVEKPAYDVALHLLTSGVAYWASGISLFRAETIVEEFRRLEPDCLQHVTTAVREARRRNDTILLDAAAFAQATSKPTERLIFERTSMIAMAPLRDVQWDDVGAWNAVHQISDSDGDGNVTTGDVVAMDTTNSMIRSDGRLVVVIGMQDVVVVETADAVLVTNWKSAQKVKQVVERLVAERRPEVRTHRVRETAWGQVETLSQDAGCDMRILTVQPGASLQINGTGAGPSVLTVVSGEGRCTVGGRDIMIGRGDTLPIDADYALPLENTSTQAMRLMQMMFAKPLGDGETVNPPSSLVAKV